MKIRIASFDIGHVNFGQYVEDFEAEKMKELSREYKTLPKFKQRKVKGIMPPEIYKILDKMYECSTRVQTGVYNFSQGEQENAWNNMSRKNLLLHLESFTEVWSTVDIFVIEQQFFSTACPGRKKTRMAATGANVDAIRIAEVVYMWFLQHYPEAMLTYFSSQFKTHILGAPQGLNKDKRKKWSIGESERIYRVRGDQDMINIYELSEAVKRKRITTEIRVLEFKEKFPVKSEDAKFMQKRVILEKQKLCDISDANTQCQAFKYKNMIACF
jgi:hypothetical protein